jgi:uncharacterized protein YqhQ
VFEEAPNHLPPRGAFVSWSGTAFRVSIYVYVLFKWGEKQSLGGVASNGLAVLSLILYLTVGMKFAIFMVRKVFRYHPVEHKSHVDYPETEYELSL